MNKKNREEKHDATSFDMSMQPEVYRHLIHTLFIPVVIFEAIRSKDGSIYDARYIEMNKKNEELMGFKCSEVCGKTVLEIFPETEKEWFAPFQDLEAIKNQGGCEYVCQWNGFYLHASVYVLHDDVFVFSAYDISEQEALFQRDLHKRKMYQSLFDNSGFAMALIDPKDGIVLNVNKKAEEIYGYSRELLGKRSVFDINVSSADSMAKTQKVIKEGHGSFISRHKTANNKIIDVECYFSKIVVDYKEVIQAIILDITRVKADFLQLRRLSKAIEQSPVSIGITNIDGLIEYVNPCLCETTGYEKGELLGKSCNILKSGKTKMKTYEDLWKSIKKGNTWLGEFYNRKKDGTYYWESASIAPVFNDDEIINFIKIGKDITIKKELIAKLEYEKRKAEESDRLKSAFLANMSHEIRTPMNGILGFTNLLLEPDFTSEKKEEFINIIKQSGDRLLATINDLINVSKLEAGLEKLDLLMVNINEQLEILFYFFKPEAETKNLNFDFSFALENRQAVFKTDESKLSSILTNLIKNAIKFTDHGAISFGYECISIAGSPFLRFFVKDTGMGICKERQHVVFNRFEQADIDCDKAHEGSGLGLAIAKSYVELLEGEIWLESEEGVGSQFYFTLPLEGKETNE